MIGAIKEGEELVGATNLGDLLPLLLGGIEASGVVCAGVKDNDGLGGGGPKVLTQTVPIHPLLVGVPVPVIYQLQHFALVYGYRIVVPVGPDLGVTSVLEQKIVVTPCGG